MKSRERIAVIGAGLVGSLLARMLARRGHEVSVFEKRPDPSLAPLPSGRSTHLVISVRGWKALDMIGATADVRPATLALMGRAIHSPDGGIVFQPYGEEGASIHAIHRNTLNRILLDLCMRTPGVSVQFSRRCLEVDTQSGGLVLEDAETGDRLHAQADRIFAADGAFSQVRMHLLRGARFDYRQEYERFGYKELSLPADSVRTFRRDTMHAWPRGRRSLFAFPNADGSFTATMLAPFDGADGFDSLRSHDDVTTLFRSQFPDVDPQPLADEFVHKPISSLVSIRCSPWTFDGRLALIGDAAHAMVPFLGQGMNAGFEDCTVLEALLDRYEENFERAFADYERLRRPHADAVTAMSARAFAELTEHVADPLFHVRKKLERKIHSLYPDRFVPPYELIAFTHLPYGEVLERIDELDVLTAQLMNAPDVEQAWDSATMERRIHAAVRSLADRPKQG